MHLLFSEWFYGYIGHCRYQATNLTSECISLEQFKSFKYHIGFEYDNIEYYCDMNTLFTSVCLDQDTNIIYPIVICSTKYVQPDTDCIMDYDVLLVGFDEINKLKNCYQFDLDDWQQTNLYNLQHHCIRKLDTTSEVNDILKICIKRLKDAIEKSPNLNLNSLDERIDLLTTNLKYWFKCDEKGTKRYFKDFKKKIFEADSESDIINLGKSSICLSCVPVKDFYTNSKEKLVIKFVLKEYTDGDNVHYLTNSFYDWLGEDLYNRFVSLFDLMILAVNRQKYRERIKDRDFKKKFPLPSEIKEEEKHTLFEYFSNVCYWLYRSWLSFVKYTNENPSKFLKILIIIAIIMFVIVHCSIQVTPVN